MTLNITTHPLSERTFSMGLLMTLVRPFRPKLVKPPSAKTLSKLQWSGTGSPRLDVPSSVKKEFVVTERDVEGIWCYDIGRPAPKGSDSTSSSSTQRRIYYFCGGGFQAPPSSDHWSFIAQLVRQTPSNRLTVVSYPLVPRSSASTAIPALVNTYHALLSESVQTHEHITFMGDSSGANVVISLVLHVLAITPKPTNNAGHEIKPPSVPNALFLISPVVDLANINPDMQRVNKLDPVMTTQYTGGVAFKWRGQVATTDPIVSPIHGDLTSLAKHGVRVNGVAGTWDVLTPDTLEFLEKCNKQGVEGDWWIGEGQMHCFPLAWRYKLKNSIDAKDWIINITNNLRA